MELRQLRYFLAVAEELHFGHAAEKLHMSQPPLSLQVSKLERELGVRLFDRSTRNVALTPAGIYLRDEVRRVLGDLDQVVEEMHGFANGKPPELSLGFVSSASCTVLPKVTPLFKQRHHRVTLTEIPLTSGEQVQRVIAGTLDLGIVRDEMLGTGAPGEPSGGSHGRDLVSRVVHEERLAVCLPKDHPLASKPEISADEIADVPLITYPRDLMPGFVDRVTLALGEHAQNIRTVEQVVHQETALGYIAAGVGMTILPESIRELVPPSVAVVPLAGSPTTRLMAATRARPRQKALVDAFLRCLSEVSRPASPSTWVFHR
jgi:DNA-binding transcriptional LysR family regulator